MAKELTFQASTLPFDELIRVLNNGYYLNTFEFGSIKAVEIPWPTVPTIKNTYGDANADLRQSLDIDPNKLDNKICKISKNKEVRSLRQKKKPGVCTSKFQVGCRSYFLIDDSIVQQILDRPLIDSDKVHDKEIPEKKEIRSLGATKKPGSYTSNNQVGSRSNILSDDDSGVKRVREKKTVSDLTLDHSCTVQDKTSLKKQALILPKIVEKEGADSSTVIKSGSVSSTTTKKVSSVSGIPLNKDDEEKKLECSKRKMKMQYDEFESEKKRRRIHVIEHQKDIVTDQRQAGQRAKKAPLARKQLINRKSQFSVRRMKLDPKMVV